MPNDPHIYRQYAYLSIKGYGPSESITKIIGIQPDEDWSEGDSWERECVPAGTLRNFTSWRLNSGLAETEDLNEHIRTLLVRLIRKRKSILSLQTDYSVKVVCVSFNLQAFSFELDFELQKELVQLGLRIWFDAYFNQDPHELISDLKQQLADKKQP